MRCNKCNTALENISATVRLSSQHSNLFCPLCGQLFGPFEAPGIYFENSTYFAWNIPAPLTKTFHVGNLTIEVAVQPASLPDCFFERLVFFKQKADDPDPPHFNPVKPERQIRIKECTCVSASALHRTYKVVTTDLYTDRVTVSGIEVVDPEGRDGTALWLWPSFRAPKWNKYYIAFFPPALATTAGQGKIHSVRGAGTTLELGSEVAELSFAPESIVLVWSQAGESYFARYDTTHPHAPHLLEPAYRSVTGLSIGYDLGTTNTAAAGYLVAPHRKQTDESLRLAINDGTLRLLDGTVKRDNTWLPQPSLGEEPLRFIPSQLYFFEAHFIKALNRTAQPVRDFTIPFYQSQTEPEAEERCIGQFKWANKLGHYQNKAGDLRYLYCGLSLEMYLAEVVMTHKLLPGPMTLVTTYPLAFGEADLRLHNQVFSELRLPLERDTGFQITLGTSENESYATEACGEVIDADVTLYMDVGGGTTDICISEFDGGMHKTGVVDSIEFGGEDVNLAAQALSQFSPAQLRQQIRVRGAEVYRDAGAFRGELANVAAVRHTIECFRRGLIETAARFLAAESIAKVERTPRFGLMMSGSGWKTIFDSEVPRDMENAFKEAVCRRLQEYVSIGLIATVPDVYCHHPADPKAVVCKGAARLAVSPIPTDRDGDKSYLLEDLTVTAGRTHQQFEWYHPIPIMFATSPSRVLITNAQRFSFEKPEVAGEDGRMVRLEELHISCVSGCEIARSPFVIYLSKVYRQDLVESTMSQHA